MPQGFLAEALMRSGLLGDIGRNARGFADAAFAAGKGLAAQVKSGLDAAMSLGAPGAQRNPDGSINIEAALNRAADVAGRSMEQTAPYVQPYTQEGGEYMQRAGDLLQLAEQSAPGQVLAQGYDAAAINAPWLMAPLAAVAGVAAGPSRGVSGTMRAGELATLARQAGHVNLLDPPAPAVINIGHKVGDVVALTPERIEKALAKRGVKVRSHHVRESGTEPTSVIAPDRPLSDSEAAAVAKDLKQDAIAQQVGDEGSLFGPRSDEWGPFNPDFFLQPEAPFARFAEEYPPVGPPEMKLDKKKGTTYPAKSYTDEGRDFLRQRLVAQRDIDEGNYAPYFDTSKRFDADLLNHPSDVDTYTQGLPAKPETVAKWRQLVQTDEARARLQAAFDAGKASGGHDAWYKMGQLEQEFIDELGPVEGPKMFRERFANAMSATTSGATPEANLLMAHYGNFLRQRGQRAPEAGYLMPPGVGNQNAGSNMALFNKQINDGGGLDVHAPKRHNFTRNFLGDASHSTIDAQMTDLITPGKTAPEGDSYFAYEELVREMAEKNGVAPRDFQDVVWGGKKFMTTEGKYRGKPMIEIVNEAIERTHRLTGMPKRDIVRRGLVRAEIPLYGAAGAGLLAPLMQQDDGNLLGSF